MFMFCFCFDLILYSAFDTQHNTNKQPKQTNNNMLYSSTPVELRRTTFSFFFLSFFRVFVVD